MNNPSSLHGLSLGRLPRLLILLAGLALTNLSAQTASTGVITGRVQNIGNERYLNNARISIVGSKREAFTNNFGEYRLVDVPTGEVKLQASFEGLVRRSPR